MIYDPAKQADIDKISEFFKTRVLSAGTVDRPLRTEDTLAPVLSSALEAIAELESKVAALEARLEEHEH